MSGVSAAVLLTDPQTAPKRNYSLLIGTALILILLFGGLAAQFLSPIDPNATGGTPFASPSAAHWLGTDNLGRDSFTRVMIAGYSGVITSALATVAALALGALLGLAAGYQGGWFDSFTMRVADGQLAIPGILVALIIRVIFGAGTWQIILAMAFIYAPSIVRISRGAALELRDRDYIASAKVSGVKAGTIIVTHVLPNALSPLLVQAAAIASSAVALEATLSYLGQGIQPPHPSAGRMIFEFQTYLQTDALLVIAPGVIILALAFGWNLIANGLQTHFSLSNASER